MDKEYLNSLNLLKGKTVAIVYIFEGEDAPGFGHYHIWKGDVISGWLHAVQELECVPFILDVRTFINKATSGTLPRIDYVVNLNCGSVELSSMSLVPSMCSFLSIPCIPSNSVSIVCGENKKISNLLASAMGLNVPKTLDFSAENGIYRPLNLGSSEGIKRGPVASDELANGIYQEFIAGYELTMPLVFNPCTGDMDMLPPIAYIPKSLNPNWLFDSKEKESLDRYDVAAFESVDAQVVDTIVQFAKVFPVNTYCRIDARIRHTENKLHASEALKRLEMEDLFFLEINTMPTIGKKMAFEFDVALESARTNSDNFGIGKSFDIYCEHTKIPTGTGFILACSMMAYEDIAKKSL